MLSMMKPWHRDFVVEDPCWGIIHSDIQITDDHRRLFIDLKPLMIDYDVSINLPVSICLCVVPLHPV